MIFTPGHIVAAVGAGSDAIPANATPRLALKNMIPAHQILTYFTDYRMILTDMAAAGCAGLFLFDMTVCYFCFTDFAAGVAIGADNGI